MTKPKEPGADSADYEVGYGRPPVKTRFTKGQSGNPRGRPRREAGTAEMVNRVLAVKVPVVINGRRLMVPTREAALHVLRTKALGGDLKALKLLEELASRFDANGNTEPYSEELDREILNGILKRIPKH